jgi:tetratricopeptide (TPR) repeat protein
MMSLLPIVVSSLLSLSSDPPPPAENVSVPEPGDLDASQQPPAEAVEAFRRGRSLYAKAEYEQALAAFRQADDLHPAADLQYNIALCHMRLHNWAEAIAGFEIYLRTKDDPADRADVEMRIAEARRQLAQMQTKSQPPEPAPPPRLPPDPTPVQTDRPDPEPRPWVGLVAAGGVLLGVGVVGTIGGGVGFGLAVDERDDQLEAIVSGGNPRGVGYAEARQLEDEAARLRTYQWTTVGVGSAVAATGAVLLGVGLQRRRDAQERSIAIRPLVGPAASGVTIGGRF